MCNGLILDKIKKVSKVRRRGDGRLMQRNNKLIITVAFVKCVELHFFFLKASGLVFLKSSVQFSVNLNDLFLSFPMTKLKN